MKLKVAYFGTPDFSARLIEKIITDTTLNAEIILVVTQPDRPVGRRQILTPSPVKTGAQKYDIEVFDRSLSDIFNTKYKILNTIDIALLYAYGEIIPANLLRMPKLGFWNIHPSLLPKYRGASPIAYPLLLGDTVTGVTLMQMDQELDHGPIIAQEKYTIQPDDKRSDLEITLTDLGFELFRSVILSTSEGLLANPSSNKLRDSSPIPQNDEQATYTRRLTRKDGFVPFPLLKKALNNEPLTFEKLPELIKEYYQDNIENCKLQIVNSSKIIFDYFRGLTPWPGLWTLLSGDKRLKITDLKLIDSKLLINKAQVEGKQEVDFSVLNKTLELK